MESLSNDEDGNLLSRKTVGNLNLDSLTTVSAVAIQSYSGLGAVLATATSVVSDHGPPFRIMIDVAMAPGTGDDEDDFLGSGSGSGGSGDSPITRSNTSFVITIHHSTPAVATLPTKAHIGDGGATEHQGDTSSDDGLPIWIMVTIAVSVTAVLLMVTLVVVCLVRRKRKAAMAQRSARWDRASGAQVTASHKSDERAKPPTQPTSLPGYYLGAPTSPAPTSPPPPPPDEGEAGPMSPPPTYSGPVSPALLLHYDSLRQDGYDFPGNNGYLTPGGQSEYEEIKI